jgi:hypothetical protein
VRRRLGLLVAPAVAVLFVPGGVAAAPTIVRDPVPGAQPDNAPGFAEMAASGDLANVVMFGAGDVGGAGAGDQTWVYDTGANAWSQRNPANAPGPRQAHAMSAIAGAPRDVILYGGVDENSAVLADTWRWKGASGDWEFVCGACGPGQLARASIATDGQQTLMFGGSDPFGFNNNVWRFDAAAGNWLPVTIPGPHPVPRGDAHFAFDGTSFVLFGGLDNTFVSRSDTWRLVPDGGGGFVWQEVCTQCGPSARALGGFTAAFGGALLVGGEQIDPNAADPTLFLSDVWYWNRTAWEQIDTGATPTPSHDDPDVPYSPLLASLPDCALLAENHADGQTLATRSFRLCEPTPPVPPAPPAPVPAAVTAVPTFTA